MVSSYLVASVILAMILGGWLYFKGRSKKHIEQYGPLMLYHTKRGIKFIERVSELSPLFWKVFSTIGIIVGFFFMADAALGMYSSAKMIIETPGAAAGATLVLPGLEVMGIKIPLLGWLVGVIVLLFVHEFSHGIIAKTEKIRIQSVGGLFIGLLPIGAFVKPDEKQLQRVKTIKRLRIFAAGSFVNILVSMIVVAVLVFAVLPAATSSIQGIMLTKIDANSPAYKSGLRENMQVTQLDGITITGWQQFREIWTQKNYNAGDNADFTTTGGNFIVTLADRGDGKGKAGIVFCGKGIEKVNYPVGFIAPFLLLQQQQFCETAGALGTQLFWLGYEILVWIAIINFGVGIVNLLPIKPLDGGLMMEAVVKRFIHAKKLSNGIVIGVSLFVFLLLLINIALPHIRTLLHALGI